MLQTRRVCETKIPPVSIKFKTAILFWSSKTKIKATTPLKIVSFDKLRLHQ